MSPKFHSVLLCGKPFWVTGYFETSTPKAPKMNLRSERYTIYVFLVSQISLSFAARREIFKIAENSKCTELPQTDLTHLAVYIQSTYFRGPNFGQFCSTTSRFEKQGYRNWETHRITSNWPWTLDSQKYRIYLSAYPRGPNFGLFRSTSSHFQNNAHLLHVIPHWLAY